jgi:hypothetical protein
MSPFLHFQMLDIKNTESQLYTLYLFSYTNKKGNPLDVIWLEFKNRAQA